MNRDNYLPDEIKSKVYSNKIYKYRSLNLYSLKILSNKQLFYSDPLAFNDPFDNKLPVSKDYSKEDIRRMLVSLNYNEKEIESQFKQIKTSDLVEIVDKSNNSDITRFKVCCFSKNPAIIPMWSYYADSHSGFCLGFNPQKDPEAFHPFEISYPKDNYYPVINFVKDKSSFVKLALYKSNHWSHEEEIRSFSSKEALVSFKEEALEDIIFGLKTSDDDIKLIKNVCSDLNVKYFRCVKNENKVQLDIDEL